MKHRLDKRVRRIGHNAWRDHIVDAWFWADQAWWRHRVARGRPGRKQGRGVSRIPDGWAPAAHDLLEQRPELAGVGVSDAVNAVVSA